MEQKREDCYEDLRDTFLYMSSIYRRIFFCNIGYITLVLLARRGPSFIKIALLAVGVLGLIYIISQILDIRDAKKQWVCPRCGKPLVFPMNKLRMTLPYTAYCRSCQNEIELK